MRHIAIIGASLAGLRTAQALRHAGFDGELTIVGEEAHPPYNRPPLTKSALIGGPDIGSVALPDTGDVGATWRFRTRATALDLDRREVELDGAGRLRCDGIVIATGASAVRLRQGGNTAEVHHVRTLDDAASLHHALSTPERRVLIIGAGFLGSEIASTAIALEHRVTLVEAAAGPMLRALGPEISAHCSALHRGHGVDLRPATTVLSLSRDGDSGDPLVAVLADPATGRNSVVRADIVVAALGARPNTGWLANSGLTVSDGVATDESLTALDAAGQAVAGVVAVGDVAKVPQPLAGGTPLRIEHWATAVAHARVAAATLVRGREPATVTVPSFWTELHGTQIRGLGLPGLGDTTTVVDGSFGAESFVVTRHRHGRLVGAIAVNNTPALMRYRPQLQASHEHHNASTKEPRP